MNMFEYLTGGQCYKCGGKVKYPDGGMTEQPMSPEQQMMMGQQMPQQPAAPQAKTLDAFADQLITFLLDQLNKGTSLRILKKTLTDSGLKSEEADQVLQIAKQQFDTVSYENQDQKEQMMQQMMQQQQMMGQQQGQPMQQMQQMTPEDMTAPGQDIAEAQYGGMMTGRRLKRYIGGGINDGAVSSTGGKKPEEYDPEFKKFMEFAVEYEQQGSSAGPKGYIGGGDNWGTNDPNIKTKEQAMEKYYKNYWPRVKDLPPGLRTRALQMAINTGDPYGEIMVAASSMKGVGNPFTETFPGQAQTSVDLRRDSKDERKDRNPKEFTGMSYDDWNKNKDKIIGAYNANPQGFMKSLDTEQERYYSNLQNSSPEKLKFQKEYYKKAGEFANQYTGRVDDLWRQKVDMENNEAFLKSIPDVQSTIDSQQNSTSPTVPSSENNKSNPVNPANKSPSWNVPDWSDPYGTEGQPPSALDTVKDKEETTDVKNNTDALRQKTPVRTETRRHMLQDVGSGKFNRGLDKASGLADPNVAGMISALSSKGGLGSIFKVGAGLLGAGAAFAKGIQKVKPNETTVEYNADGQVISREGGEWNPFVDNRRKLRIGMQLYGGGGPITGEKTPFSINDWALRTNRDPNGLSQEDYNAYDEYANSFSNSKNNPNVSMPSYSGGAPNANTGNNSNNNTVTVPPASNNQTVNSGGKSGNQGACPPGQDCSGQNASDPKWWQFGKRMQQEYGNTKRGDALGTTFAGRTLTGLALANMGLDEIEARKQQEQLAVKTRQANNSMNAFGPLNLLGQEGIMNVNAGIGANFKTSEEGVIQDYGTALYGKSGGQMKYKQGGTYTVSPEELMRIINMGGEVEFLD